MTTKIKNECVSQLLKAGLKLQQIDEVQLAKDWYWWEDVELTCLFYVDRIKEQTKNKKRK